MKLVESKAEYIPQEEGLEGIYKQIEQCARTCYKSESKTTDTSYLSFIDRLVKSGHTAMLEHGTVYLAIPYTDEETLSHYRGVAGKYNEVEFTRYSKVTMMRGTHNYVTTNYRVLVENNWLDDLKYLCPPTEFHERRYTMRFTCSRAISHELVRSRTMSFAQESQRYVNYSKDKYGVEITFIEPTWINDNRPFKTSEAYDNAYEVFCSSCEEAEGYYMLLIDEGFTPQQARDVLPNATKTEIVVTGFSSDWKYLLDLRLFEKTGKVHPDMLSLMQKLAHTAQEAHITQNLTVWDDIMSKPSKFD